MLDEPRQFASRNPPVVEVAPRHEGERERPRTVLGYQGLPLRGFRRDRREAKQPGTVEGVEAGVGVVARIGVGATLARSTC